MNCFEARYLFVAFWQKRLDDERKAQLTSHLSRCRPCDRSFRAFALTAPTLHSVREPDWSREPASPAALSTEKPSSQAHPLEKSYPAGWQLSSLLSAFVLAAAAAVLVYLAVPSRMTFEDAIAVDNNVDTSGANYSSMDSFVGQELVAQNDPVRDVTARTRLMSSQAR